MQFIDDLKVYVLIVRAPCISNRTHATTNVSETQASNARACYLKCTPALAAFTSFVLKVNSDGQNRDYQVRYQHSRKVKTYP